MRLLLILILISSFFISCGGVQSTNPKNPDTQDKIRQGDVDEQDVEEITDSPETLIGKIKSSVASVWKKMGECESSIPVTSGNVLSIGLNIVGYENPADRVKECTRQQLEEASEGICENQRKLDTLYRDSTGYSEARHRIVLAYQQAQETEDRYRENLRKRADELYKNAQDTEERRDKTSGKIKRALYGLSGTELQELSDIFYYESELTCQTQSIRNR